MRNSCTRSFTLMLAATFACVSIGCGDAPVESINVTSSTEPVGADSFENSNAVDQAEVVDKVAGGNAVEWPSESGGGDFATDNSASGGGDFQFIEEPIAITQPTNSPYSSEASSGTRGGISGNSSAPRYGSSSAGGSKQYSSQYSTSPSRTSPDNGLGDLVLEPPHSAYEPAASEPSSSDFEVVPPDFSSEPAMSAPFEAAISEPVISEPAPAAASVVASPTAGAPESNIQSVDVFYGTDRNRTQLSKVSTLPLQVGLGVTVLLLIAAVMLLVFNRLKYSLLVGGMAGLLFLGICNFQKDTSSRDGIGYGVERGTFVRGIATVTIPPSHQRGIVERPSIMRFEFAEDENKHVVLTQAKELDGDEFYQQMNKQVSESNDHDLLVFIHGYNVDFDSAVRRTAQIANDLSFEGVPVCYSWPSQGSLVGYTVDENNVIWTVRHLRDFLLELADRSQAKSINIIAHSMGNRAMTESLSQLSNQLTPDRLPLFDRVVLAAPDVDADHFRIELAPQLAEVGRHVTLYASSDDQALLASKHLHGGYPRAGESGENLVVVPHIETIDVSGIDLSLLGHSYYGNSESILHDLYGVVRNRLPASQRSGLISRSLENVTYWMLPRAQLSEETSETFNR